jgi:hypothetical protein
MKDPQNDIFLTRILKIMRDSVTNQTEHGFRSAIVSEVRTYSQLIDDKEEVSHLFLKICDLLLDCESKTIPENSFKLLIANLVHEQCYARGPSDDEIRQITGMSTLELDKAGEALKGLECLSSVSRNSSVMKPGNKPDKKKSPVQPDELDELDSG